MNLTLVPIDISEKETLRGLLKNYEQELTGQKDPGEYKYLDSYWEKDNRHPYFIKVNGETVGFVLVNGHTLIEKPAVNIAEFYVKKGFRKKGIGKKAAFETFNIFPGKWEVRELKENISARDFWNKVISEYTNNNYKEVVLNNETWSGPVQTFDNTLLVDR